MIQADLSIIEVTAPIGHWCDSGHQAPELFKRNGTDSAPEPTKFFKVSNDGKVFCEPCLILANYLARIKKDKK